MVFKKRSAPQTKCSSPHEKQRDFTSDFRNYGVQKAKRSSNEVLLKRSAPQTKCSSNEVLLKRSAPRTKCSYRPPGRSSNEVLLKRSAPQTQRSFPLTNLWPSPLPSLPASQPPSLPASLSVLSPQHPSLCLTSAAPQHNLLHRSNHDKSQEQTWSLKTP